MKNSPLSARYGLFFSFLIVVCLLSSSILYAETGNNTLIGKWLAPPRETAPAEVPKAKGDSSTVSPKVEEAKSSANDKNNKPEEKIDLKKKLREKYEFDYKPFITGKEQLGMSPDEDLYNQIYYFIRLKYVNSVSGDDIEKGVLKEVERFLKQAGMDTSGLKDLPKSNSIFNSVLKKYSGKVNKDLLAYACIRGMLDALNDPHSVLMLPKEYAHLKEQMAGGNFSGIGIYIMMDPDNKNRLTVSEPIEGTPADKAGLKPADIITAINGESTEGKDIEYCVSLIRGEEGTPVTLTIQREGMAKPFDVVIKRAFIHVNSVQARILNENIGYIKLRIYGSESGEEIDKALTQLESKGAKAIILDIRNNSGGLIDSAQDVCSRFLPAGTPVVSVIDRAKRSQVYRANGGMHEKLPMVVLINELSASASEITAGALKDHNRATIIGEVSFGKGSVQELMPIRQDDKIAALKLTIALFYSPGGRKIDQQGVEPNISVPMDVRKAGLRYANEDIQLQKAIKYLKEQVK